MMTHDQIRERLDDYVDDLLPDEEAAIVDRHLLECRECSREVAELRSLLAAAAELPDEIAPARDLWPGIEAALDDRAADGAQRDSGAQVIALADHGRRDGSRDGSRGGGARRFENRRLMLAAAGLALLMLVPATLTMHLPDLLRTADPGATADPTAALFAAYDASRDRCFETMNAASEMLPPRTIFALNEAIAENDAAVVELKTALAYCGQDAALSRMLTTGVLRRIEMIESIDRRTATI